ncbi:MAG: glycoside hydrolase family 2 protein [Chloroflexota bacterium]|nr:glycoside hydrolase family 2 protein [Chloroflexota bacterium]
MASPQVPVRTVLPLNRGWRYADHLPDGCTYPDFDDAAFAAVTLPHANRLVPWHGFDDHDYQFVSIYRRRFTPPAAFAGQRVFVDFARVMTAATVWINGVCLGEHRGGFTPFSFELTPHLRPGAENLLAVEVDSTERPDIPPFGGRIDYLTFGGIYREVALRAVPPVHLTDVFAEPVDVLGPNRRLEVRCELDGLNRSGDLDDALALTVELRDGERVVASTRSTVTPAPGQEQTAVDVTLTDLGNLELWDLDRPRLYGVAVHLSAGDRVVDTYATRVGFREARFTEDGFILNGRPVKLRGLNRHQTYPYVGGAMPARVQRRDAQVLKHDLACNIVRTSHYPQSSHFLDACDELGLLVFTEMPGWQHIGDAWQDLVCRDVEAMIRRDRNHPSIVLWGVRINESPDDRAFYLRTNALAHALDDSRQTGGVRNFFDSELLEDVFTINDFNPAELTPPFHARWLVTEFIGHMFPTKHADNVGRVQEHVRRHADIHDQIGQDPRFAGGIGWCAFDYNTHREFGSGDRVCYHGVSDIFRIPKPAAGFYASQRDPADGIVLEPAFHWALGDHSGGGGIGTGLICSNCDRLKLFVGDRLVDEVLPDRAHFPHLPHPPFVSDKLVGLWGQAWHDLTIEGYLGDALVVTRRMAADGVDRQFHLEPDDDTGLVGDGSDMTRVVLRVADAFGNPRPFATGAIALSIEGPGEIVGENPFDLVGGVGAVWLRTREDAGTIRLTATHPVLGTRTVEIAVAPAEPEGW